MSNILGWLIVALVANHGSEDDSGDNLRYQKRSTTRVPCKFCKGWYGIGDSQHDWNCPLNTEKVKNVS